MTALLTVSGLGLAFGGLKALDGVDMAVRPGTIHALIGPNGAGKTSLLNCINGFYHPGRGAIAYKGQTLDRLRPDRAAQLGIARVFQNVELFGRMTVLENLILGRHRLIRTTVWDDLLYYFRTRRVEAEHREQVETIIELLELEAYRHAPCQSLPYGVQKRVELGRALAMEPELLLLDEPVAGMNNEEKEEMARFILETRSEMDLTILLVEHDMSFVFDLADWVTVLDFGRRIADGEPAAVARDPEVRRAYLGSVDPVGALPTGGEAR